MIADIFPSLILFLYPSKQIAVVLKYNQPYKTQNLQQLLKHNSTLNLMESMNSSWEIVTWKNNLFVVRC